ncbi:MAG: lysylphosphatidylglycerol synthase domain-containing protein [bacterium]
MIAAFYSNISATLIKNKNRIIVFLKIIIAVGLLLFLLNRIEPAEIVSAISNADHTFILLTLLFGVVNISLQFYKWKVICQEVLKIRTNRKILYSLFYGFAAGIFTPFRLGEYVGRAIPFKDNGLMEITIATIIDKFFPLIIIFSVGSISSIVYIYFFYKVNYYVAVSLLLLIVTLLILVFSLFKNEKFWNGFVFIKLSNYRLFKNFNAKISIFRNLNSRIAAKILLISFLFYTTFIIQFAFLAIAFSGRFELLNFVWIGSLVIFSKTIIPPISLGELGIREGVTIFFLGSVGISEAAAFNTSIFLFLINLALPSLVGLLLLLKKN